MNYFSHYYFDHTENPNHNYGLLFPDFVRNFLPKTKLFETEALQSDPQFALGVAKHFQRDHLFHASSIFEKMQDQIKPFIKSAFQKMNLNRYYFVMHIFTEMLIDRVLIKKEPALIDQMYEDVRNCKMHVKTNWVEQHHASKLADFLHRLQRFETVKYIKQYTNDYALSYSVNRVCMYVKVCSEWTENQTNEFLRIIEPCEQRIFENVLKLKKDMTS